VACAFWLLVVGAAMATRTFKRGLWGADGLESAAMLILLLGCASSQRLRASLAGIGMPRLLFVAGLTGLVLWGQLVRNNRVSYPFLQWSMYTKKDPPNEYFEYRVRHRSGEQGLFRFGELMAFTGPEGRVLENRIARALQPDAEGGLPAAGSDALRELVATYNRSHQEDPVVHMLVTRLTVPIRDFAGRESIRREPVLEVRF
jgi:hypothetical protein